MGNTRAAADEFARAFALSPSLAHAQIGRALSFAIRHQQSQGVAVLEMLYKLEQAYAQLEGKPSALRLLRRSIELNFYPYAYFVRDPLLEPVRGEPAYAAVMELARQRQEMFLERFR